MNKILLFIFFTFVSTTVCAESLSIVMQAAPASGLRIPRVMVVRNFKVYHNIVNFGDTWTLTVISGIYKIMPLPVSDGTDYYFSDSVTVFLPPGGSINYPVTYHA